MIVHKFAKKIQYEYNISMQMENYMRG